MSTLTTIGSGDYITNSRADINGNFAALNTDKEEVSNKSTDSTFASADDTTYPTTLATKKYVDAGGNVNASTTGKGIVEEATQAEVDAGTATGGTGARLFVNPSTTMTKFATTQVFTGTAPTTFTDLDLSSVVGAKQRMVMLVCTAGAGNQYFTFKRKGSSYTFRINTSSSDTHASRVNIVTSGDSATVIVSTDANGVVQWSGGAAASCSINVEAYW